MVREQRRPRRRRATYKFLSKRSNEEGQQRQHPKPVQDAEFTSNLCQDRRSPRPDPLTRCKRHPSCQLQPTAHPSNHHAMLELKVRRVENQQQRHLGQPVSASGHTRPLPPVTQSPGQVSPANRDISVDRRHQDTTPPSPKPWPLPIPPRVAPKRGPPRLYDGLANGPSPVSRLPPNKTCRRGKYPRRKNASRDARNPALGKRGRETSSSRCHGSLTFSSS